MNNLFKDDPNIVYINDQNINPEELIDTYASALEIADTRKGIEELLWGFLAEAEYMILRDVLVSQAKEKLAFLEAIEQERQELLEKIDDDK